MASNGTIPEWSFPSNGGGAVEGFNNAAIDHFSGARIQSLVRESIQNSLDARKDKDKPVRVSFTFDEVSASDAIGIAELAVFLKLAKEKALRDKNTDVQDFLSEALGMIGKNKESFGVFGIHDSNTTGLRGPVNIDDDLNGEGGQWLALVKGTGHSHKPDSESLGSFGHGSKAPIAVSKFRTVFYFTKIDTDTKKIEERFQGKCILMSMKMPDGHWTQATGFFGEPGRLDPLIGAAIPGWARDLRSTQSDETGTSVFIPEPDLNCSIEDLWNLVKLSTLRSFYFAVKKGHLAVEFGDGTKLESNNLIEFNDKVLAEFGDHVDTSGETAAKMLRFNQTIQNPTNNQENGTPLEGTLISNSFGDYEWFMRVGVELDSREVAVARQNGMLITHNPKNLERFPGTKPFSLFVCVTGRAGVTTLRSMENPAHDRFEPDRIKKDEKRKKAEKDYKEFCEEIRALIVKHAGLDAGDEAVSVDLEKFLGGKNESTDSEGEFEETTRIKIGPIRKVKKTTPKRKRKGTGEIADRRHYFELKDLRIVREDPNELLVKVYFTPKADSAYSLSLLRSGIEESEVIAFRDPKSKTWEKVRKMPKPKNGERIELTIEVSELAFTSAFELEIYRD
jgi:hypothetical protein